MSIAETSGAIRDVPTNKGSEGSAVVEVLALTKRQKDQLAERWTDVIDRKLIEWGKWRASEDTQNEFRQEDFVGPTGEAIAKAYKFVKYMRGQGWPLPTGIIPDGEGGIAFENKQDTVYQRIEIDDCGIVHLATFRDCRLLERGLIDVE